MSWLIDSDSETESLDARLPHDQSLQKPTRQERHARTGRRCIILVLLVAALLTVIGLLALQSNVNQGTPGIGLLARDADNVLVGSPWRDKWAHLLAKGIHPIRGHGRKPLLPNEVRTFDTSVSEWIGPSSCLYLPRPRPSEPPDNWLVLPMVERGATTAAAVGEAGCSFSSRTLPQNVIFFHGGTPGNSLYQDELRRVATEFNVNVVSPEFPGFETRQPYTKATEAALLQYFPVEIDEVVTKHLGWRWSETAVWAHCFGVPVALNALWRIGRKHAAAASDAMPATLMLTNTLMSHRYSTNEMLGRGLGPLVSQIIPPYLYSLLPSGHGKEREMLPGQKRMLEYFTCPVLIAAAANDRFTSLASNHKLMEHFVNACYQRLVPLPNMGHMANIYAVVACHRSELGASHVKILS